MGANPPREELVHQAQLMHMAWAPVQSPAEILACPHLEYRNFFQVTNHTSGVGEIKFEGLPFTINGVRPTGSGLVPIHGETQPTDLLAENVHPHPGIQKPYKHRSQFQNVSVLSSSRRSGNFIHRNTKRISRIEIFTQRRDRPNWGVSKLAHRGYLKVKPTTEGLLKGIRVLDFTRVLAGPFATRMLADLGAEVIKVQSRQTATGTEDNPQPYFRTWNRNKRSITLNMDFIEARELALQLVAVCDIVVENFSPRVMSNWDMGFENLKQANPLIILLSMSGMGQTGPWRDFVAYGQTVQALGGLTLMTGQASGHPLGLDYAYADPISGLYGIVAVLAALADHNRTGQGCRIDLSEYEAACTAIGPDLIAAQRHDADACLAGDGEFDMTAFPRGVYPCKDRDSWCAISVREDRQWRSLCRTINKTEWFHNIELSTVQERLRHREELDRGIAAWTGAHGVDEAVDLLRKAGVPARPVSRPEDLMKDPQLRHRGFFRPLSSSNDANPMTDANPICMDGAFKEPWQPSPGLGRDNRYVFLELLGMSESQYNLYREKSIIA